MLFAVFLQAMLWPLLSWPMLSAIFAGQAFADSEGSAGEFMRDALETRDSQPQATKLACQLFSKIFPSQTYYPNGTQYDVENQR
jgi:hypothetical protein